MLEVVGDATDVVFMTVGDDHPADALLVLPQKTGVRQNHIHAVHAIAWEGQTGIHQHQIVAVLEHTGVLTDFMQSPQGNHPETRLLSLGGSCVVGHERRLLKNCLRKPLSRTVRSDEGQPWFEQALISCRQVRETGVDGDRRRTSR